MAGFPAPALAYRSIPDEVKRGMDLVFERRFAEAIEVLSSATERYPASPEAHFYLGLSQYSSDMPVEAAAEWERTVALDPDFPRARTNLALAYYDTGDLVLAERNARLAEARNPRDHLAHLVLGRALRDQLRSEEALVELARARDLSPKEPGIHAELAELNQDMGQAEAALAGFQKAVALAPANPSYRFLLGLALFREGRDDLAEKEFAEAIRLDPENVPAYYNLGLVYLRKGHEPGTLAMIDVLKTRNPAWADELGTGLSLQAGEREAAVSTESVPFRPRLVRGFTFVSEFTRRVRLSFHPLESNREERHESELAQKLRWEVVGGDERTGFRVACTQESFSSSLDGKALPDPLLADTNHSGVSLSLDAGGRVISVARGGAAASPAVARHFRRLWANSFLAGAPTTGAVGSRWSDPREVEIPLAGWRTFAARLTVESFEPPAGGQAGVRSARIGLLLASEAPGEEPLPSGELKGEGKLYVNPEGCWMSSARVLLTGSLVVAIEGKNSQVQFSIQESQSNR